MGLLSECKFCHQYFSSAGMAEHVQSKHGALIRAKGILAKFRAQSIAEPRLESQDRRPIQARAPSVPTSDRRLTKAEQAQKVRSELQGRKNQATAAFIKEAAQKKANPEPLDSVWKEQVAKLAPLKAKVPKQSSTKAKRLERSYALQQQRVPSRERSMVAMPRFSWGLQPAAPAPKRAPPMVDVPCSCGGENERCFRCDGRGYYEVSAEKAARMASATTIAATPSSRSLASFASDPRGAAYGVREQGRFASAPIHDDFGDDSSS